jgi:hypothetical protein
VIEVEDGEEFFLREEEMTAQEEQGECECA